jgi:hypothetical protein
VAIFDERFQKVDAQPRSSSLQRGLAVMVSAKMTLDK